MKGWNWHAKKYHDFGHGDEIKRDVRILKFLKNIKVWQLLIILLVFLLLAAIFLRLNSLGSIDLYENLKTADKTSDTVKVQKSARKLQNYVAAHMNTSVPRLPLQTLYNNAAQKALDAAKPPQIDETTYQKATDDCIPERLSGGAKAWARCVAAKVGATGEAGFAEAESINPDAYYIEYAPTRWSPDAAGITILICLFIILVIFLRVTFALILRLILKFKYRAA